MKKTEKRIWNLDDVIYVLMIGILLAAAVAAAVLHLPGIREWGILGHCRIREATGLICPGCGGSRAVSAFLHGDFIACFRYHPLVLYTGIYVIIYLGGNTLKYLSKGRWRGVAFHYVYLYIGVGILIANWIVKNYELIWKGKDLLRF